MMSWVGIVVAGMLNGSFAVPMKTARTWKFEHIWGVFSVLAMTVIPWVAVVLAVPHWEKFLAMIPGRGLAGLIALGLLWGVASLLYGRAVDLLGIALGFSIQLGLSIVIGALIPFAAAQSLSVRTPADAAFLAGVALMVAGVIVCALAGRGAQPTVTGGARFRKGLIIAVLGGIGSPLLNIGIDYGISLLPRTSGGASLGQWVAWAVFLSAATISQAGFCFYRISRSHGSALFRGASSGRDASLVLVMSVVWAVSIFLYGASAASLGRLGTSVGWPVFIGLIVITSNAWGVALGEWKDRSRVDLRRMLAGSAVLIAAAFVIGQARVGW
jgi:L-rhamnose-H+ transport protein